MWKQARESQLIARAVRGDAEAFGDLYEAHLEAIYNYIYYRISNAQDAEDLTEAVFLKAWQAMGGFETRDVPFKAWLYRIAHNLVIDYYRTRKELESLDGQRPLTDHRPHPEESVQSREMATHVARSLQQLPPLHQDVLLLRFVEGLSHAETAEALERTEGAVRVLQHRALKALQALLAVEEVRQDE